MPFANNNMKRVKCCEFLLSIVKNVFAFVIGREKNPLYGMRPFMYVVTDHVIEILIIVTILHMAL